MYDPKSYDLAVYFLEEGAPEDLREELAQEIQDTVEDWLRMETDTVVGGVLQEGAAVHLKRDVRIGRHELSKGSEGTVVGVLAEGVAYTVRFDDPEIGTVPLRAGVLAREG